MNSTKEYDYLVFIARAQPFHKGHQHVINTALEMANHVIVLLGSANASRSSRNPFSFKERETMISEAYNVNDLANISILPLDDYTYCDSGWVNSVHHLVNEHLRSTNPSESWTDIDNLNNMKIGLIGHSKDHSSYYLRLFPNWGNIDVDGVAGYEHKLINATDIRNLYFGTQWHDMTWSKLVPERVAELLHKWIETDDYQTIVNEHKFITDYKKQWSVAPYPPIFCTVDSIVVQSGYVLMVERGAQPGLGKLALPGGFLNQDETLLEGAIRELKEETGIKLPIPVLKGSLKAQKTFDDPHRSARGRTITNAFLFYLFPQMDLPKVRGGDDASKAMWVQISELKAEDCFDDHFFIVKNMTAGL